MFLKTPIAAYSERPKSKHVRISDRSPLSCSKNCSVLKLSEIRTNLFGFQTVLSVWNRNKVISNGTNLFGFQTVIQQTCVWNPNKFVPFEITLFRFQTDKTVWNPNKFVRISDRNSTNLCLKSEQNVRISDIFVSFVFSLFYLPEMIDCPLFIHYVHLYKCTSK